MAASQSPRLGPGMSDEYGGTYHRLEHLLARPELLEPPPVVLPRLAWSGRVTLLASPEKTGKSTLVGQAVAAKAQGKEFLGEPTERGATLWLALDEPLNDVVRRLSRYGARDHVAICQEVQDPASLEEIMREIGATVLVIDTLSEFARGLVDDYNSAAQWTPQLHALRSLLQRTEAAGILLHHSTKATGRYRDSSAIGAGVDAILELNTPAEDPVVRVVRARGRMVMSDFRLRFVDPWYQLDSTEAPLELRVYRVVESRPGVPESDP